MSTDILREISMRTKHGPSGTGDPGPCDKECLKCLAEDGLKKSEAVQRFDDVFDRIVTESSAHHAALVKQREADEIWYDPPTNVVYIWELTHKGNTAGSTGFRDHYWERTSLHATEDLAIDAACEIIREEFQKSTIQKLLQKHINLIESGKKREAVQGYDAPRHRGFDMRRVSIVMHIAESAK